ncbi:MAG: hypothetical protein QGI46_13135 [Planctomycetota bacterium]|jgi:serine/threonine protein kinase|nr:hypothetical protein [Planctomycetota bacterium]
MIPSAIALMKVLVILCVTVALPVALIWGAVRFLQGTFWLLGAFARLAGGLFGRLFGFVRDTITDSLGLCGALLTTAVVLPLAVLNVLVWRWDAAGHYGRALEGELEEMGVALWRLAVGNPVRLLGLERLTEGIERRLPRLLASAPAARGGAHGSFDGFEILDTLPAGGSGARLFLARPTRDKLARWRQDGKPAPGRVVIKSFALDAGSTLPQIVRESRALEAASRLGLVCEHELDDTAFHYVMPYVPGEELDGVIAKLHARRGAAGLCPADLALVMSYASDLLYTLDRFHSEGLWHKDIKPANLIVSRGRAHLVDLGLVTPLGSAMTLTTHGTEYYRDPEMVRMALKGVKVHEVDGVKFDLYSAGALLYSMVEGSFPAHGSLSRITRACPEALQWIVRRSMGEVNTRYRSAGEMLADLRTVAMARDPHLLKPADLPSVSGRTVDWSRLGGLGPPRTTASPAPDAAPSLRRAPRSTGGVPARALVAAGLWGLFLYGTVDFLFLADAPSASASERAARRPHEPRDPRRLWARHLDADLGSAAAEGAIVVIDELGEHVDPRILGALREELEERGFEVLGGPGGEGDEREIHFVAGARRAVGLAGPDDPGAVAALERHLAADGVLQGAIWLTVAEEPESLTYRFVRPRAHGPEAARTFSVLGIADGSRPRGPARSRKRARTAASQRAAAASAHDGTGSAD